MSTMMEHRNSNSKFYQYDPMVMDDDDIVNSWNAMENGRQPNIEIDDQRGGRKHMNISNLANILSSSIAQFSAFIISIGSAQC